MFIELAMHMDTFMYVYDVSNIIQPAAWVHIHKMRLSLYIGLLFCECVGLTLVQIAICRVEPKEDWSRLTCGHMICHLHMNYMIWIYDRVILAVNLRNSTERNSMQRKLWMDVDSLNLDYFFLVRFRDYVLCCQIALFKSFKSLRLQNPTTLQRPMFRFFNA